jgi:hypothetical protein
MSLIIRIDDPRTIELLCRYAQFIAVDQGVDGSIDEHAEGLMLACLDDNAAFMRWEALQLADGNIFEATDRFYRRPIESPR